MANNGHEDPFSEEPFNIEDIFRNARDNGGIDPTVVFDQDPSTPPLEGTVIVQGEAYDVVDEPVTKAEHGNKLRVAVGAIGGVVIAVAGIYLGGQLLVNVLEDGMNHDKQKSGGDVPSAIALPTTSRTPFLPPVPTIAPTPTETIPEESSDEPTATTTPEPTPTVTVTQSAKPAPTATVTATKTATATATATQTVTAPPQVAPTLPSPNDQETAPPNGLVVGITTEQQDGHMSFFDRMRGWFSHHHEDETSQADTAKTNIVAALRAAGYVVVDTAPADGTAPNLTIVINDESNAVQFESSGWNMDPKDACLSTQYGTMIQQQLGYGFPLIPGSKAQGLANEPVVRIGVGGEIDQNGLSSGVVNGVTVIQQNLGSIASSCS